MSLRCFLPCCCRRDRAPELGLQEPSAPAIQPLPDVALQAGEPAGGPGGSRQDQQGPQGPSIVELQGLHSLLMQEIKSLKKAAKYSRRLESVSLGAVSGLRDEVADMQALLREEVAERRRTMQFLLRQDFTQGQQSETRNGPQHTHCVYQELPRTTEPEDPRTNSMLCEFFSSLVDPSIYRLDEDVSESNASVDSGNISMDLE